MRPTLTGAGRAARLAARSARAYTSSSRSSAAAALAALSPLQPAADRGPPPPGPVPAGPAPASLSLQWRSTGLSPQQVFEAHTAAQMGGQADAEAPRDCQPEAGVGGEAGELEQAVAGMLRDHLERAFGRPAAEPAGVRAPGMCAPVRASTKAVEQWLSRPPAGPPAATPRTLEAALQPSTEARMVVEAAPPHAVAWANGAWEEMARVEWTSVLGQPCLQAVQDTAPDADTEAIARLAGALRACERDSALLEHGGALVRVTATPLERDGRPARMLLAFAVQPHP